MGAEQSNIVGFEAPSFSLHDGLGIPTRDVKNVNSYDSYDRLRFVAVATREDRSKIGCSSDDIEATSVLGATLMHDWYEDDPRARAFAVGYLRSLAKRLGYEITPIVGQDNG